jgi:hypothetical protein
MIPRSDPYLSGVVFFTALIGSARRKIGDPPLIHTVRHVGYTIDAHARHKGTALVRRAIPQVALEDSDNAVTFPVLHAATDCVQLCGLILMS